jgi:predicted glycosyltransferase
MDNCERIALYSHDALGLGHLRRNLAIAGALAGENRGHATLLVTGAREAGVFPMPAGTDCLALPALTKAGGRYRARSIGMRLDELVELRAGAIASALEAFDPDVLIVDKKALGIRRELRPSLEMLKAAGHASLVLGLRDVLDTPAQVREEWSSSGDAEAALEYYDAVWIYGDPQVYDVAIECDLDPGLQEMVSYSGYLARQGKADEALHTELRALGLEGERFALCLVGGGQDGHVLADRFAHATFPAGMHGVVLTGPFMPQEERHHLHRIAEVRSDLRVIEFVRDATVLIRSAACVVAMGGYNTVCEVLAAGTRALIVPRTTPRREQLIRAQRMSELGLIDMVAPTDLRSAVLSRWIARDEGRTKAPREIDLDGLRRLPQLLDELLGAPAEVEAETETETETETEAAFAGIP